MSYSSDLHLAFKEECRKNGKFSNVHTIPSLSKISIHICEGKEMNGDKKLIANVKNQLALISGQMPVLTKAKNSHAGFKIREGMIIGAKVTLRRKMMFEFLDRLVYVSLARIRDFKGISLNSIHENNFKSFSVGIPEMRVFPEIDHSIPGIRSGCNISFHFNAVSKEDVLELCKKLNIPFKS